MTKKKNVTKKSNKKVMKSNLKDDMEMNKYLFLIAVFIIAILAVSGVYTIINYETSNKYQTSYLVDTNTIKRDNVVDYNNAATYFGGLTGDYYIYISYTNNKNVYNLEKQLRKVIKNYNLEDKFYYINIDSLKNDSNVTDEVNAYLGYRDAKVSQVPTIVYVNKSNVVRIENIIARDDNSMMSLGDFQKLLDINDVSK